MMNDQCSWLDVGLSGEPYGAVCFFSIIHSFKCMMEQNIPNQSANSKCRTGCTRTSRKIKYQFHQVALGIGNNGLKLTFDGNCIRKRDDMFVAYDR